MIDTHIHLDDAQYDPDREEVIWRFFAEGGEALINIGAGMGTSRASVELAKKYDKIYAAVGLHPHYFMKHETFGSAYREELKSLAQGKKVVGIGEIGLDYYQETRSTQHETNLKEIRRRQEEGFLFQLDLAKELKLPVVIHCREAYEEVFEILKTKNKIQKTKIVYHCYGGGIEYTRKLLEFENINFSFTGNVTYVKPGAEIMDVIEMIPLEKIMLETDGPYLTPVPHRGKRNDPRYVFLVAQKISEIKKINLEQVLAKTNQNARNFFGF